MSPEASRSPYGWIETIAFWWSLAALVLSTRTVPAIVERIDWIFQIPPVTLAVVPPAFFLGAQLYYVTFLALPVFNAKKINLTAIAILFMAVLTAPFVTMYLLASEYADLTVSKPDNFRTAPTVDALSPFPPSGAGQD